MNRPLPLAGLAAAILALGASPAARADDAPPTPPAAPAKPDAPLPATSRFIDTYDANGDGRVMKAEFTGEAENFDLLDTDKDGCVTPAELGLPADYKPDPNRPKPGDAPPMGREPRANAAERLEKMKRQFAEWDTDKDGKVTKEEYKGKIPFATLDRNGDGVLSAEDARGGQGRGPRSKEEALARFKEQDKNGDGKVTREEFPGPDEAFKARDANGDGAITPDEVEKAAFDGPPGGGKERQMRFARMDADKDGKLSKDEFKGGPEMFAGLDKDGDGFLTPGELEAMAKGPRPGAPPPGTPGAPGAPGGPPPAPPMDGDPMGGDPMGGAGTPPPPPGGAGPAGGLFATFDKNRDGKLSREEFPGDDAAWRRLDRDANGWITPEEAAK